MSLLYRALDDGVPPEERKNFRLEWNERGSYALNELLILCARPDWASYPETFFVNPWIAQHWLACEAGQLCYFIDQWLGEEPLPTSVSADPFVEDRKVSELEKLFSALNR